MLLQLWARDWSDSMIPVLLNMSFHIPYYCTILWHLSHILEHPLAHLPVHICPAGHSQRPWAWPVCPRELTGSQPGRRAKNRKKWVNFLLNSDTQRGLCRAPDLSINSKVTWRERRKANGIFNHLRLKFFGKRDKGKRIQFSSQLNLHQGTRVQKDF